MQRGQANGKSHTLATARWEIFALLIIGHFYFAKNRTPITVRVKGPLAVLHSSCPFHFNIASAAPADMLDAFSTMMYSKRGIDIPKSP